MGACVFGPVPSRRLGRSLGIDLIPHKTCPYDCVYCQVGRTTDLTLQRKEWVPLDEVLDQVRQRLHLAPDAITLSGSGEPTLYSRLGELIERLKQLTDIPIVVLTNGALLWMPDVRRDLLRADIVIPSLDAPDPALFETVNRPHPEITFERMFEGLETFRREYDGRIWLEVFLLADLTAREDAVRALAERVRRLAPDRVHINTVARPPAEGFARPVAPEDLQRLKAFFGPEAEVIAVYQPRTRSTDADAGPQDVLDLIARHPCTIGDVASGLGLSEPRAMELIERLCAEGRLEAEPLRDGLYYQIRRERPGHSE